MQQKINQISHQSYVNAVDVDLGIEMRSKLFLSQLKTLLDFTKLSADIENVDKGVGASNSFDDRRAWVKDAINPDLFDSSLSQVGMRHLTLKSTLQELSLHDFEMESQDLGQEVAQALEANPLLPGVILKQQGQFLTMISRRRFLQIMSRPYGLALFLQRPIEYLYRSNQTTNNQQETLILPADTLIVAAAQQLLQRSPEELDEPIVVEIAPQVYRLLDVHQLLAAQSQIHQLATQLIQELYKHLEAANEELQYQANSENLIQLANSSPFKKYLDQEWQRLAQEKAPLSLILCDVDFFKTYNDTYGHQAEDECLQQVAKAIRNTLKRSTDLVVRYGGKEFAVILPHTAAEEALRMSEIIRMAVSQLEIAHIASPVSQYLILSLGVASIVPSPQSSTTKLMAAADQALHQAKASRGEPVISK